jgi:UTP--glucose-1-phosphate uridylyltransferase
MTKSPKVTKAVIAAAGFGTRFLPQTKAMPKEMLPLIDKPIIQYIVEDLVAAGIRDIIIVSNYSKRAIEDHFDMPSAELAANLQSSGKEDVLQSLRNISNLANFVYVRQKEPLGNAAPLLYARHLINDEPFIYTWGDDLIKGSPNRFEQMIDAYSRYNASIVPCIPLTHDEEYKRYGIVAGERTEDGNIKMSGIVEKPGKTAAPSNLASVGGYLLTSDILEFVERSAQEYDGQGELKIQTAMQAMIDAGYDYLACEVKGTYYDAGNKLEYLKTVIDFGLAHQELGPKLRAYIKTLEI